VSATEYTEQERGAISAAEAAASNWLIDAGYEGATDDQCACLLDKSRADEARGMVDHWQARCDLPEALANAILDKLPWGGDEFLAAFPQTERGFNTGGGCMAWRLPLRNGGEILITDGDGGYQPERTDIEIVVGRYFADGDPIDDAEILTWAEAIEFVTRSLAEAAQS
jgi:hypothetical protein